jgi:hypothetical protein
MSFFIAALLAAFSGVLYLAGQGGSISRVCLYTLDLCQHPYWPLILAGGIGAFGLLFRVNRF